MNSYGACTLLHEIPSADEWFEEKRCLETKKYPKHLSKRRDELPWSWHPDPEASVPKLMGLDHQYSPSYVVYLLFSTTTT